MNHTFDEKDWYENFQMRKETFIYLCDELRPHIERQDAQLCPAISVQL